VDSGKAVTKRCGDYSRVTASEPRDFEAHQFRVWLIERLSADPAFRQQRENRATISALLERSGALL
jgi:hypothetical protein